MISEYLLALKQSGYSIHLLASAWVQIALSLFASIPLSHNFLHVNHGSNSHTRGGKKALRMKMILSLKMKPPSPQTFLRITISTVKLIIAAFMKSATEYLYAKLIQNLEQLEIFSESTILWSTEATQNLLNRMIRKLMEQERALIFTTVALSRWPLTNFS